MGYPFGESRIDTAALPTDRLYTGQREIADFDIGLYHYNARFYSPSLGRFVSADTVVSEPRDPRNFNRYSYVLNNPLRYVDPTGHEPAYCDNNTDLEIGADISQADCWLYLRDKYQFGFDPGAPQPGHGYQSPLSILLLELELTAGENGTANQLWNDLGAISEFFAKVGLLEAGAAVISAVVSFGVQVWHVRNTVNALQPDQVIMLMVAAGFSFRAASTIVTLAPMVALVAGAITILTAAAAVGTYVTLYELDGIRDMIVEREGDMRDTGGTLSASNVFLSGGTIVYNTYTGTSANSFYGTSPLTVAALAVWAHIRIPGDWEL